VCVDGVRKGCVFCSYGIRMCLSGRVWYDMGMFCLILWFGGSIVREEREERAVRG
jgi:hypothetical protein